MEENNIEIECCEEQTVSEPYCDPIFISGEIVEGMSYDTKSFESGVSDGSYYAGIMSAMISAGMNYEDSVGFVFSMLAAKQNIEMTNIQKDSAVESSKNVALQLDKQTV